MVVKDLHSGKAAGMGMTLAQCTEGEQRGSCRGLAQLHKGNRIMPIRSTGFEDGLWLSWEVLQENGASGSLLFGIQSLYLEVLFLSDGSMRLGQRCINLWWWRRSSGCGWSSLCVLVSLPNAKVLPQRHNICNFASVHHHNGCEIKASRCDWSLDFQHYFNVFNKNIILTV